ncbi:MAG: histidine kinase [Beijerinckiaceae bacterium]
MADYYPLIARAVAAVKDAPSDMRAQVYERARAALIRHLKASANLSPEAVEREEASLDEAIARVETEILSGEAPGSHPDPTPRAAEPAAAVAEPSRSLPPEEFEEAPPPPPPRRPLAPAPRQDVGSQRVGRHRWRLLVTGGMVAMIAVAIAAFAISRREDPGRYSPQPRATAPADQGSGPKLGERVGEPAEAPPAAPSRPEVAIAPAAPSSPSTAPAQPPVAVAQRAILYEERPETPNEPTVVQGRAVWRLEPIAGNQGDASDIAIKADLEFPERALAVEMTIRRNTDAALPASHLVEIKFIFRAGGGPVKELASPPTMKLEENQRGSPLLGLQVPVMENYFLVGLSNLPTDVERNISQLQSANWIDIPLRFGNDRIGVIAIEKGTQGADAMQTALARWKS